MAVEVERLIATLEANLNKFDKALAKAVGGADRSFTKIERRGKAMEDKLAALGKGATLPGLRAGLAGVSAALSIREVARYADAWTGAKNSLAVAGVVGAQQVDVLDQLYQSAQRNATPITALAGLYGKAAQASDNLGASQDELIKFSDGVAVALRVAGTSSGEASGALTQLGQLLGSARVQAEEFNSVNEGARPILMAVANGLDAAGGSVSRLKQLVNDGKVSGQQFFQAFLKGLPSIEAMAANSTTTIEQGLTKVENAVTKYIGQTDASLGASQRLVAGLSALADNFSEVADVTVQVAAIIAGALVGRSLAGLIAKLALSTAATLRFVAALRAASALFMSGGVVSGLGAMTAAGGPLGIVIGGVVVGALSLFAARSADAAARSERVTAELEKMGLAGHKAAEGVDAVTAAQGRLPTAQNIVDNTQKVRDFEASLAELRDRVSATLDLFAPMAQPLNISVTGDAARKVLALNEELADGKISLKEFNAAMDQVARNQPSFAPAIASLQALQSKVFEVVAALGTLSNTQVSVSLPVIEDRATRASKDPTIAAIKTGQAFAAEAQRRNGLTKEQLALEDEIAKVRKDADASGGIVTDNQVKTLATDSIAADARRSASGRKSGGGGGGGGKSSGADDYQQQVQSVRERTAAVLAETQAMSGLNPLVEDYGYAVEKVRAEQDLLNAAQQAGLAVTPALKQSISDLAGGYAQASSDAQRLAASQDEARQSGEDMASLGKDVLGGFISDIRNGTSATEALGNALDKVADKLIDMALNAAFSTSGGGGILGSLLGAFTGGLGAPGAGGVYADGGYTGRGGKYQPAGTVHKGEFVFDAAATRRIGPRNLEAIRRGMQGYAEGGLVGPADVTAASRTASAVASSAARGPSITIAPAYSIDARGSQMGEAQLRSILRDNNQAVARDVRKAMPGWLADHQRRFGG